MAEIAGVVGGVRVKTDAGAEPVAPPIPCGAWPSPITAAEVGAGSGSLTWAAGADGAVWWVESEPENEGRLGLWRAEAGGEPVRITPHSLSVRNRVHEYGGCPWAALPGGGAVVTNWSDQRAYAVVDGRARPLTPAPDFEAQYRYAEPLVVGDEVWFLREEHSVASPMAVRRAFVAVPLDGRAAVDASVVRVIGGGHHFLAGLRVAPNGRQAAWIGWDHPRMSWEGTDLVVAELHDGRFHTERVIAGGPRESIVQVEWEPDGALAFLSDASGWWNLHRVSADGYREHLLPAEREFGGALWRPGTRWFAVLGSSRYAVLDDGRPAVLDVTDRAPELLPVAGVEGGWAASLTVDGERLVSIGGGNSRARSRPVSWNPQEGVRYYGGAPQASIALAQWLPIPESRRVPVAAGGSIPVHLFRPTNPVASVPVDERPPYIVHIHGGPTGQKGTALDLEIAYFTSRGIGVAVPEYRGSTGYGRAWRERLDGDWGVADLEDAVAVADALVAEGLADPDRLVIRGGSAGGFTSAAAMTSPSPFAIGLISYPVIDLLAWMSDENHDLESQYLTSLVGPLPETAERYRDRSPAERPQRAHGPMLILQGLDDRICLPQTTERFVSGLRAAGKPHEYIGYPGEQHGFRAATTVADAVAREFDFLRRHLSLPTTPMPTPPPSPR